MPPPPEASPDAPIQFEPPVPASCILPVLAFGEILIAIFIQLFVHDIAFVSSACSPKGASLYLGHPAWGLVYSRCSIYRETHEGRPSSARGVKCGPDHTAGPADILPAASTVPLGTPLALYSRTPVIESKCSL